MNLDQTPFAPLAMHLVDLIHALETKDIEVTLVGGFGLILRRLETEEQGLETYISNIPQTRATEDFDLLIDLEALKDHAKMITFREVLDELQYQVIERASYYQFFKAETGDEERRNVKVDLLAPSPPPYELDLYRTDSGANKRRISARTPKRGQKVKIDAHITPEAIASEEQPRYVNIEATGSDSQWKQVRVRLPHPYTLYNMKLHAFRDEHEGKKGGDRSGYALKHAGDLYTITTLLTREEFEQLDQLRHKYGGTEAAQEAARIVHQYFATERSGGAVAVRTRYTVNDDDLKAFLDVLNSTFPNGAG